MQSRLIVGTGKYKDAAETKAALAASGAEIVTVALRRVDLKQQDNLLSWIDRSRYTLLPNTAGCYTADEAVRTLRLARELGIADLVKLEVIGDPKTLLPDNEETLRAAKVLIDEGFTVLPYTTDDPVVARRLVDAGASCVMPLGSPIGSGLGVRNPLQIQFLREAVAVPVIVDAGVGTASDAALAMEIGVDAILMNTAVALADDPVAMAEAMALATRAGRLAYQAGRIPKKLYATASSPLVGIIE